MTARYSKKHVRRVPTVTDEDSVGLDESGLVVTCQPVHWPRERTFDFRFLVPFAAPDLASSIALAFGRFAVRFARRTSLGRYTGFRSLWLAVAAQKEPPPFAIGLRTGVLASWWREAAIAYAGDRYDSSTKATSAKTDLQNTWTVLDELASCGLLVDVPPKEPPRNLHLTKVPRPSLIELASTRAPSANDKSALVRHFRAIGVPVDDAEAERYVHLVAGLLTPEELRDPKTATAAYVTKSSEYLQSLAMAAESQFVKWQGHYLRGQKLLQSADAEVLSALPAGLLPAERGDSTYQRFFPTDDVDRATGNFLLLMREYFQGRVPSAETLDYPWRARQMKMVRRLGGTHSLDAMLSLHREGVAAAALLYLIDTGANVATTLSLEADFERPTSDPNYVEFFAVKSRAKFAAIYDVLPINDPGRVISTVKALRAAVEMTSDRRARFPHLGNSLFVFKFFHEPSVANAEFLAHQLRYLLKATSLPSAWTLSGIRAAVGIVNTLDGTGTLNALRRKLNHGRSSFATTAAYALRWPIRKQLELEMARYQKLFQAGVVSNVEGALQWLYKDASEAATILAQAEKAGLGFLRRATRGGDHTDTAFERPLDDVDESATTSVQLFVVDEDSLAEIIATNRSLTSNLARLEAESAERFEELWLDLLAFTNVVIQEVRHGRFAYLIPEANRKAERWLSAGFDITGLRI